MSNHVCLSCNLCCDGTLFARLAVTSDEKARLSERGQFFTKSDGALRMRLGCNYLGKDGACQCYHDRPATCIDFRCDLLRTVDAGYRSMQEAIELAEEARGLRDKARKALIDALTAAGSPPPQEENVNQLKDRLERALRLSAPVPVPARDMARFRFNAHRDFIQQFVMLPNE